MRVYYSKKSGLTEICLFSSVLACFYFGIFQFNVSQQEKRITEEQIECTFEINPNKITVNGNYLQLEGKDEKNKELFVLRKKIEDEQEKIFWEKNESYLQLEGVIETEKGEEQRNLTGFNYREYLKRQNIYQIGKIVQVNKLSQKSVYQPIKLLHLWRKKITNHIQNHFPKQTSAYMKSLLLGIKDGEFKNGQKERSKVGILHFFSISGMHVYFFLSVYRYLILRIGITKESLFWLELVFLGVFLVLTGISTSVGRSVCLVGLTAVNKKYKWHLSNLDCWSLVLAISCLYDPYMIFSAAGQLSFGLTFFIIYLTPMLKNIASPIARSFLFSFCLTVFSIPIVSYHFFEWHIFSLWATFILAPFFSYFLLPLLTSSLAVSYLFLWAPSAWIPTKIEGVLTVFQYIIRQLGNVHCGTVVTGRLPIFFYFVSICLILLWLANVFKRKESYLLVLLAILSLISFGKYLNPKGIVAFVDVGQGDSIFIQTPFHQANLLIDTGGKLTFPVASWQEKEVSRSNAENTLLPFLKSQGVKKMDLVFVTHGDQDHMGDLLEVAKECTIKKLVYPEGTDCKPNFATKLRTLKGKKVLCEDILSNAVYSFSDVTLQSLYPFKTGQGENKDSLVLLGKIKNKKFLWTGDLEIGGENELVQHYPELAVDILKAGHHGSATSSSELFLQKIQPSEVIISCGKENRYNHPHPDVISLLKKEKIEIYRTDMQGMIFYEWSYFGKRLSEAKWIKNYD